MLHIFTEHQHLQHEQELVGLLTLSKKSKMHTHSRKLDVKKQLPVKNVTHEKFITSGTSQDHETRYHGNAHHVIWNLREEFRRVPGVHDLRDHEFSEIDGKQGRSQEFSGGLKILILFCPQRSAAGKWFNKVIFWIQGGEAAIQISDLLRKSASKNESDIKRKVQTL